MSRWLKCLICQYVNPDKTEECEGCGATLADPTIVADSTPRQRRTTNY